MKDSSLFYDLRFLIGLLFVIYGVILGVYGFLYNPQKAVLHGWNINLWWGIVIFLFGLVFLAASLRKRVGLAKMKETSVSERTH
ncbi:MULTISPECIES: hypothetical protein [Thermoactinomyces]|jgi:uncharacterized membrane protein HdeD (DUF308 family)|uniref:Uncharacterized protein n=1 Tax=Thermoactinomyces daqus TaxID=1329516 RepID=A0A7W2AIY1_9BACL|nr:MULTISPECIES: hypothetical protein [Thermoactinomyces]MBA4544231.1 hypothetical protein [Thermoactinomyces daqus]MBH8597029.1 hypothetical protein [Thermoactinomyces sp. CICC 10523]MBH8603806.1 hypothetical protein [Thermoactinomyces sp. CICC 10522]MBH8608862.1 hypothetical protein [Thermoactinomyces sp. CICC 10521]